MSARERRTPSSAVRAEPAGIGTAGAHDTLSAEVRLLGSLLGQVVSEQAGPDLFELVERVRRRAIALRQDDDPEERRRLDEDLADLDLGSAEAVIESFALYFQLVNLAEARGRVRALRRRERAARDGVLDDSVAEAVVLLRRSGADEDRLDELLGRLSIALVLTAHPTEARRRTALVALRRCAALLERLDDPRLTPAEDREVRRRLREEITLLWRTSDLRAVAPTPLDEVRTAMAIFDATLFTVVPRLYRSLDGALDPPTTSSRRGFGAASDSGRTGTRPPRVEPYLHWGSWIGGDRDGNPEVTADVTERTLRIQAEHVLHGYEAVATRLMQTLAAAVSGDRVARSLALRLARDAEALPETDRLLRRRFPDEPYRQRFGFIAERLRRTRAALTGEAAPISGRYADAAELDAELAEVQDALVADRLERVAFGEVADLRWQLGTFGFHLASLEVRQHADVHRAALAALRGGATGVVEVSPNVPLDEVTATFRAISAVQARFGIEACHRFVVSFTASATDVLDVLELARLSVGDEPPVLDVVPLFESSEALEGAGPILAAMLDDPVYRAHLASRGDRQEVMLGLFGLEQGVGLPRGRVAAPRGAVGAGRGRRGARRGADALPRPRRGDRARRRTHEPRDPRPGAGIRGGPAQAHRAGRGHRRQLLRRGDRAPASRAGDRGGPPRLGTRPRRRAPRGGVARRPDHGRAGARRRGPPIARSSTTTRASRRSSATSRRSPSCPHCASDRDRPRAAAPTRPRRSTGSGRSRGRSPGRRHGSTCPAGSGSARRSSATARCTARPGSTPSPASGATGRSCAASSTTRR